MFIRFGVAAFAVLGFGSMEARANSIELLLETSVGEIRFKLYAEKAPTTVANFLKYIDG